MKKLRRGIINITTALMLILMTSVLAIVLAGVMKEVIFVENVVLNSIDTSYSKLLFKSMANAWYCLLSTNSLYWDSLHEGFSETPQQGTPSLGDISNPAHYTEFYFNTYIKHNITGQDRMIYYKGTSKTASYDKKNFIMSVGMELSKKEQNETQFTTLLEGASFDFGWPSM